MMAIIKCNEEEEHVENRTEQNRTEQNRTEQNDDAEQTIFALVQSNRIELN